MKRTIIVAAVAQAFIAATAWAQADNAEPDNFKLTGTVGVGGISLNETGRDRAKLFEYRDMSGGFQTLIDLKGRSDNHSVDLYGENLGRDDMYLNLSGSRSGSFKYLLYSDRLTHNFSFGARTPYSGAGSANQTATLPNLNPASWNSYDIAYKRRNDGGAVEFSFGTPFYARLDASQSRVDGNQLQSYAQGTSPGNGFVDLAVPVAYTTKNLGFEVGYGTQRLQLSLHFLTSKFDNENPVLAWTNGYFNGIDRSPLAPDNDYQRWSANAVFKQLPVGSTLALRYTQSDATNTVDLLRSMLSTPPATPPGAPGTQPAANPTSTVFRGDVNYDTYSIALNSNPSRTIDTKLYLNHFKKDNASTKIDFAGLPTGFGCGDAPRVAGPPALSNCNTELFSYRKQNYGVDTGWRFLQGNKLAFGYEHNKVDRERPDSSESKDNRYSVEWKNQSLDMLTTRLKYQYLERRSNFLESSAGLSANDPEYLLRYTASYDVSSADQNLFKLALDISPATNVDLGAEIQFKQNKYNATVLGRSQDDRREIYLSASFGDRDVFRLTVYVDQEVIKYDSTHRTISTVSSGAGTAPNTLPSGFCQTTNLNCFDPFAAPTAGSFNWSAINRDTTTSLGLGAEWPATERLTLKGSVVWSRSTGDVGVQAQRLANGAPAAALLPITGYGNNEKFLLNVKGDYQFSKRWAMTFGAAYENVRFNDVQFNNYTYIAPAAGSGASTSYLSGWYADPDYTAGIIYLMGKYSF